MKKISCTVIMLVGLILFPNVIAAADNPFIAKVGSDGIQRVEIVGGSYFFKPNHIVVKVNVPVEFSVRKEGGLIPHDFVLNAPEAGMDVRVDLSSEPKIVRFTPTKPGKYEFLCDKKSLFSSETHADKGMKGILEVAP